MASEYTTIIKLDPFFQRFLCAQFDNEFGQAFKFPPKHDFNRLLSHLVQPCPVDYRTPDYGESMFRIHLPNMEHKDVSYYNYLSKAAQTTFINSIRRYWSMLYHDDLTRSVKQLGLTRMEAIDHLMDEFGFSGEDYDRLIKEYQRWYKTETMRRYRKRVRVTAGWKV